MEAAPRYRDPPHPSPGVQLTGGNRQIRTTPRPSLAGIGRQRVFTEASVAGEVFESEECGQTTFRETEP